MAYMAKTQLKLYSCKENSILRMVLQVILDLRSMENITVNELKTLMDCCYLAASAYLSETEQANRDFRTLFEKPQDIVD